MALGTQVYALKDVVLSVAGRIITGFENVSNAISYTPNTARVTSKVGMDGSAMLNVSADKSGVLEVRLLPVHDDNNFFATFLQALDLGGQVPLIPVHLKKNGGDFVIAGEALIENVSTGEIGVEAEQRVWRLVGGSWLTFPGAMAENN